MYDYDTTASTLAYPALSESLNLNEMDVFASLQKGTQVCHVALPPFRPGEKVLGQADPLFKTRFLLRRRGEMIQWTMPMTQARIRADSFRHVLLGAGDRNR